MQDQQALTQAELAKADHDLAVAEPRYQSERTPPGIYEAEVIGAKGVRLGGKGTPALRLTLAVEIPQGIKHLRLTLWLTPAAMPMTKVQLEVLGATSLTNAIAMVFPNRHCAAFVMYELGKDGQEYLTVGKIRRSLIHDTPNGDVGGEG